MKRLFVLVILLFITILTYSQVTIYYDNNSDITMKELATHYRVAKVDTALKKFIYEVKDYWGNDSIMLNLLYDSKGIKNGPLKVMNPNGELRLTGQYLNGDKYGVWEFDKNSFEFNNNAAKLNPAIDSLERTLIKKETFSISKFIRKNDYPELYSLISRTHRPQTLNGTFTVVEEQPYFPNGMQALGRFIGAFIKYPEEALKNNIKGRVIIEFIIKEDGSTTDFKVMQGLGYGCDEEAIRVLKLLPDWIPGYQHGKAVQTKFKLPITFG